MARRFAGSPIEHRRHAAFNVKEARRFFRKARAFAKKGDCEKALHFFGSAAFYAGIAVGNRSWVAGKRAHLYRGGTQLVERTEGLEKVIARYCRIGG